MARSLKFPWRIDEAPCPGLWRWADDAGHGCSRTTGMSRCFRSASAVCGEKFRKGAHRVLPGDAGEERRSFASAKVKPDGFLQLDDLRRG